MPKIDRRLEAALWILVFAAIVLAGRYVIPSGDRGLEQTRTVRIGYVSWAEGIAMTHLAKVLLEDRMGYDVELTMADPAPIFTSLAEGGLDFFLDAWLPRTHKSHMDRYGDILVDLGFNYEGARIGLVVPEYVAVNTIPELRAKGARFDNAVTGIDSGAGIMAATREAISAYDLGMQLLTSSGAAMTASLKDAVQAGDPIVVTGWKPHWMFARWELKFLEDPKKIYGTSENIHTVARPGVTQDLPEVVGFLKDFFLNDQQIGTLMDHMNRISPPEKAARRWIEDHAELVGSWLGEK